MRKPHTVVAASKTAGKTEAKKTEDVAKQYEQWVYPLPLKTLEEYFDAGYADFADPQMAHVDIWPQGLNEDGSFKEELNILVAGCGANAAARYAYRNPKATVVGIDLSEASLAHEEKLKDQYKLDNLTLKKLPIEEVDALKQEFDLIESSGVLHHLPDPVKGLKALKGVLKKPHGVIGIMVYGLHGRTGVYMLQELFTEHLGLEQSEADVDIVKASFNFIRNGHPVKPFIGSPDTQYDAGIVDLFLHKVDKGYSVTDCIDLARDGGMVFQRWVEPFPYNPVGYIPGNHPLGAKIKALPQEQRWQAMEYFNSRLYRHTFYVCHPERDESTYKITFDGKDFLDYIPVRRIHKITQPDEAKNLPALLQRLPYHPVPINAHQALMINEVNGEQTVRTIIKKAKLKGKRQDVEEFTRTFFKSLWDCGLVSFKLSPASEQ